MTNTPPSPVEDRIVGTAGNVTIPISLLLANDHDEDGDTLRIISVTLSEFGKTVQLTNGAVVYRGSSNVLEDAFIYVVEDASMAQASATVTLNLTLEPWIDSVQLLNGGVHLQFSGPANRQFHILASEDGEEWSLRGEGISGADGRGEFVDSGDGLARHRLYRIQWP
jgi:hypothetical protein